MEVLEILDTIMYREISKSSIRVNSLVNNFFDKFAIKVDKGEKMRNSGPLTTQVAWYFVAHGGSLSVKTCKRSVQLS